MFFERPDAGQRAVLLSIRFDDSQRPHDLEELSELTTSANLVQVDQLEVNRHTPDPGLCIGSGKVEELRSIVQANEADLVIVDHELTPTQQRNLEGKVKARVLTRTELIVNVFAERARTYEGKLQVELACWKFAQTHVVRGWTHLDRQRGGVNLRGAGESQANIDKGLIARRIHNLEQKLNRVQTHRAGQRRQRDRNGIPTIALVGYTNAGKSTLFNRLCQSDVYADDRLFATLDPTMRRISLPGAGSVVLADTVGFIRDLPMSLVAAFRATLEEVAGADLLLHVVDCSTSNEQCITNDVELVLKEIGAGDIPTLKVFNKVDLTPMHPGKDCDGVYVSATADLGIDDLLGEIHSFLSAGQEELELHLTPQAGAMRAHLYSAYLVRDESYLADGTMVLNVSIPTAKIPTVLSQQGVSVALAPN